MTGMAVMWTLVGSGWADVVVTDGQTQAKAEASNISAAPEDFLAAVARLVLGEHETRVQFEAEPTAFRWIFYCEGNDVWVRLLQLPDGRRPDNAGAEIWSSCQTVDAVARAAIRCFDDVAEEYGESGYRGKWREHFPRLELERLRTVWRLSLPSEPGHDARS